jgi:hypothetical protein
MFVPTTGQWTVYTLLSYSSPACFSLQTAAKDPPDESNRPGMDKSDDESESENEPKKPLAKKKASMS